jgi:voltage-gated potassium channel
MLALSVLGIGNVALYALPGISADTKGVIVVVDVVLSVAFLLDFVSRLARAPSRTAYVVRDFGWADLLSSVPSPWMKLFRIPRTIATVRSMRAHGLSPTKRRVDADRAGSTLYVVMVLVLLVIEFGGAWMARLESSSPEANIRSASDAVWWVMVTITTIGYGDYYPVTNAGRWFGVIVMLLGVSLFGVITGFVANAFLGPRRGLVAGRGAAGSRRSPSTTGGHADSGPPPAGEGAVPTRPPGLEPANTPGIEPTHALGLQLAEMRRLVGEQEEANRQLLERIIAIEGALARRD